MSAFTGVGVVSRVDGVVVVAVVVAAEVVVVVALTGALFVRPEEEDDDDEGKLCGSNCRRTLLVNKQQATTITITTIGREM